MNWNNLKSMKCPKDGKLLEEHVSLYSHKGCDFKIHKEKFDKIVSDMYAPKVKRCATFEENLCALNNLGHEKMSEDYSDKL